MEAASEAFAFATSVRFPAASARSAAPIQARGCELGGRQYLSRIEDILRIERLLQRAHRVDGFRPEFSHEVFLLALPDAVLAGAGAAHGLRALHQPMHEFFAARHLFAVVDVAQQRAMEIAVADVTD